MCSFPCTIPLLPSLTRQPQSSPLSKPHLLGILCCNYSPCLCILNPQSLPWHKFLSTSLLRSRHQITTSPKLPLPTLPPATTKAWRNSTPALPNPLTLFLLPLKFPHTHPLKDSSALSYNPGLASTNYHPLLVPTSGLFPFPALQYYRVLPPLSLPPPFCSLSRHTHTPF